MKIIQVPSVFLIKIPGGQWLNLALIRSLEFKAEEVHVTWSSGDQQTYSGRQAIAILNAWQEAKCIDKSGEEEELGAIDAQLLAHGAPPRLIDAVKTGDRDAIQCRLALVENREQRETLSRVIERIKMLQRRGKLNA